MSGRPGRKKNNSLDKEIKTNNPKNTIPISIEKNESLVSTKDKDSLVKVTTRAVKILQTFTDIFKGSYGADILFKKDTGIVISDFTKDNVGILCYLPADKFINFYVEDEVNINVNLERLHTMLEGGSSSSNLTLIVPKGFKNDTLIINIFTKSKGQILDSKLLLREVTKEKYIENIKDIDEKDYKVIIRFPSKSFKSLMTQIKKLNNENTIKIIVSGKMIKFIYKSCDSENTCTYIETKNETEFLKYDMEEEDEIINEVNMRNIYNYCKCSGFSDWVKLYIAKKSRLCVEYTAGYLGTIQIFHTLQESL